jgi:hypothetical protein
MNFDPEEQKVHTLHLCTCRMTLRPEDGLGSLK